MNLNKKKHCQKIKYLSYMSNSMIFGGHFENMQIIFRLISQLANIGFWIQQTKLPSYQGIKPFSSQNACTC